MSAKIKRATRLDTNPTNVVVTVKDPARIEIEVDIDRLRWEHASMLERSQDPNVPQEEQSRLVLAVLEAVTGQDMAQQPLRVVNAVLAQIKNAFGGSEGN